MISYASSFSGNPEALAFCKINEPRSLTVVSEVNVSSLVNGTNSSVIQSPWAVAYPSAMMRPSQFVSTTGKVASKNQVPRAFPVMIRGELILWFS